MNPFALPPQPRAEPGTGPVAQGDGVARVDGRLKVTGQAPYAADHGAPDLLHGVAVNSRIARGRIVHLDATLALADVRAWHRPAV